MITVTDAHNGRRGVDISPQDEGELGRNHIPQDTSGHARHRAHQHHNEWRALRGFCYLSPRQRKQPQPERVGDEEGVPRRWPDLHIAETQIRLWALGDEQTSSAHLDLNGQGDSTIELTDPKGTKAILGNTNLEYPSTGKEERRPASSLVLFNKDQKVFWKTP
jgi:hypothetical protein